MKVNLMDEPAGRPTCPSMGYRRCDMSEFGWRIMNEDKHAALKAIDELYAQAQRSSQAGSHEEAAQLFARIGNHSELGEKRAIFLLLAAEEYVDLQQCDKAIGLCEQAIAVDPTSAQGWGALGRALYCGGRNSEAISAFHAALALCRRRLDSSNLAPHNGEKAFPIRPRHRFGARLRSSQILMSALQSRLGVV